MNTTVIAEPQNQMDIFKTVGNLFYYYEQKFFL